MSTAVHTVQVKRKRGEDPLHALVVRSNKRKRSNSVVFRLAGTYDEPHTGKNNDYTLKSSPGQSVFKLPRIGDVPAKQDEASKSPIEPEQEDEIPSQLQSMISDYMASQNESDHRASTLADAEPSSEAEDYVYDVYYGEKLDGEEPCVGIGYIELESDQEVELTAGEKDEPGAEGVFLDDEDSNAEDFYKNEYPDEYNESLDSDLEDNLGDLKVSPDWSEDENTGDAAWAKKLAGR